MEEKPTGPKLIVLYGGNKKGEFFPLSLEKETTAGRNTGNDIYLLEESISSSHAKFIPQTATSHKIVDLGSTNGTFINGEKVDGEAFLSSGDIVRMGRLEFLYEVEETRSFNKILNRTVVDLSTKDVSHKVSDIRNFSPFYKNHIENKNIAIILNIILILGGLVAIGALVYLIFSLV